MNVVRELINFFRMQAGIVFASQTTDPVLPAGVVAFWHNATTDRFRLQNRAGQVGDILVDAPVPDTTTRGAVATDYRFVVPAGPNGNVDFLLPETGEVVDVVMHKTVADGGGEGGLQLFNAASEAPVSDAMSVNVAGGALIRPTAIYNGPNLIAAGTALRFARTRAGSTDESVIAYVRVLRRA